MADIELVTQTVNYGSCRWALDSGLFTPQQLLTVLKTMPKSDRTCVAYRCAVHTLFTDRDMDQDSAITECIEGLGDPVYGAILFTTVAMKGTAQDNTAAVKLMCNSTVMLGMMMYVHDPQFALRVNAICGKSDTGYTREHINYIVGCASVDLYQQAYQIDEELFTTACVSWDQEPETPCLFVPASVYVSHILQLYQWAPKYFMWVRDDLYLKTIDSLDPWIDGKGSIYGISKGMITAINHIFPDLFDVPSDLSELAVRIYLCSHNIRGYLLGFALYRGCPSDDQIGTALTQLSNLGPEAYMKQLSDYYKGTEIHCHLSVGPLINENNTLTESIFSYSPCDRFIFYQGKHLYALTREEFKSTTQSHKNPYTGEIIHPRLIDSINFLERQAYSVPLPPPAPLTQQWDTLLTDGHFKMPPCQIYMDVDIIPLISGYIGGVD